MTDFEAVMWELERDPRLSSAFANVTIFDRAPDRARFRARMERATSRVPRLRQRVVPSPGRIAPPEWRVDPDFDLDHHLRWVDMGGDADDRELFDLVATLSRQPFNRSKPLWEFVVIEGLAGRRAAMLQRLHHTITDGEGGIRLSVEFLDLERDPPGPWTDGLTEDEPHSEDEPDTQDEDTGPAGSEDATADADSGDGPGESSAAQDAGPGEAPREHAWWERTALAAGHTARSQINRVGATFAGVGDAVLHPTRLPDRGSDLLRLARSAVKQVQMGGHRSPLWTDRSLTRWFGVSQLHLDDVKAASRELGGSVNDLFVTGAAEAAARLHADAGVPVDELRVSIPVSTRHDRRAGGNAFAPAQTLVPSGDMSPVERFGAVHAVLDQVKTERVLGSMEGAAAALNLLPTGVLVRTGQRVAGAVDFVCSNVKAAPFDLYIAGGFMEANYPIGPLAGTAFNLTTMSYRGWLFLGLHVDPVAVEDPQELLAAIEASYDDLLRAGGVTDPRRFT